MIDVTDNWWVAVTIAAGAGLVGGLIYELLLVRFGGEGMAELISKQSPPEGRRTYLDLGFLASMLVGAVAAVGFLYFMPPADTIDQAGDVVRRVYDPFRLIPASVIVGSAGGAFLSAMQERAKRLVNEATILNALAALEQARERSGVDPDDLDEDEASALPDGGGEAGPVDGRRVHRASTAAIDAAVAVLRRGR